MGLSEIDEQTTRYLLGEMTEEERSVFEERLLRDSSFFEEVCAQEDALIMRYLRGQLDRRLASRFRKVYLSRPVKRARIESARAFRQAVHDVGRRRRWGKIGQLLGPHGLRAGVALAAVAATVFAVFLLRPVNKQSPFLGENSSQLAQKAPPKLSFILEPGLLRSGSGLQILVPPGTGEVQFKLVRRKAVAAQNYRAVLRTPERPNVWSGEAVPQDGVLVANVPGHLLVAGDYILESQALGKSAKAENQATYYFRVTK